MYDFSYFVCLGNWHRLITLIISFCARYYYCYFFVSNKLSLSAVTLAGKKKIQKERERERERERHTRPHSAIPNCLFLGGFLQARSEQFVGYCVNHLGLFDTFFFCHHYIARFDK